MEEVDYIIVPMKDEGFPKIKQVLKGRTVVYIGEDYMLLPLVGKEEKVVQMAKNKGWRVETIDI